MHSTILYSLNYDEADKAGETWFWSEQNTNLNAGCIVISEYNKGENTYSVMCYNPIAMLLNLSS